MLSNSLALPSMKHTLRCVIYMSLAIELIGCLSLLAVSSHSVHELFPFLAIRGMLAGCIVGLVFKDRDALIWGAFLGGGADFGLRAIFGALHFEWSARGVANWELNAFIPPTSYGWRGRPNRSPHSFDFVVAAGHALWLMTTGAFSMPLTRRLVYHWRAAFCSCIFGGLAAFFMASLVAVFVPKVGMGRGEEGAPLAISVVLAVLTLPAGMAAMWLPFVHFVEKDQLLHAGVCRKCGYDLRGSPGPTCPECGELMPAVSVGESNAADDRTQPPASAGG